MNTATLILVLTKGMSKWSKWWWDIIIAILDCTESSYNKLYEFSVQSTITIIIIKSENKINWHSR